MGKRLSIARYPEDDDDSAALLWLKRKRMGRSRIVRYIARS